MAKDREWRTILCSGAEHLDKELIHQGIRTAKSGLNYDNSRIFANSDVYTRLANVKRFSGKRVCVIQSATCSGELDPFDLTTGDRVLELLQVLDVLRNPTGVFYDDDGNRSYEPEEPPERIEVLLLHTAFSKQDQIYRTGESNSSKLALDLIYAAGVDRLVVVDPHAPQDFPWMQQYLREDKLGILSMYPHIVNELRSRHEDQDLFLVSTPGKRRTHLAHELPEVHKERLATHKVVIGGEAGSEVKGKRVFLLDDMVISGTTIKNARRYFLQQGAREVLCWITHPLPLARRCEDNLRALVEEFEGKVFVSNTVRTKTFERDFPSSTVSCVPLLVEYLAQD